MMLSDLPRAILEHEILPRTNPGDRHEIYNSCSLLRKFVEPLIIPITLRNAFTIVRNDDILSILASSSNNSSIWEKKGDILFHEVGCRNGRLSELILSKNRHACSSITVGFQFPKFFSLECRNKEIQMLLGAAGAGHVSLVKKLYERCCDNIELAIEPAAAANQREVLDFLEEKLLCNLLSILRAPNYYRSLLLGAAQGGHKELFEKAFGELDSLDMRPHASFVVFNAYAGGCQEIISFCASKGTQDAEEAMNGASLGGHLEIVKGMVESGVWVSPDNFERAVRSGNLSLVEYLIEKMETKPIMTPDLLLSCLTQPNVLIAERLHSFSKDKLVHYTDQTSMYQRTLSLSYKLSLHRETSDITDFIMSKYALSPDGMFTVL